MAENKVQFICHENLNAPTLPSTWGALISILDSALVSGLNLPSINNVQIDGSVILIKFITDHKLKLFQLIELSGFAPQELNDKWRIIGVPNTLTIGIECIDSVQMISTIGTARLPSLGYEKVYSDSGKGVYRNSNPDAEHRPYLRVDATLPVGWTSTYAKFARVAVMTECSGIDDITSQYQLPYDNNKPDKNWLVTGSGTSAVVTWAKWVWSGLGRDSYGSMNFSNGVNSSSNWMIIGDEKAFYLIKADSSLDTEQNICGFGVYDYFSEAEIFPYFLASNLLIPQSAITNTDALRNNGTIPFCGCYSPFLSYTYNNCSNVLVMSKTGTTVTANTYFGKHATNHIWGGVTSPHYVQAGGAILGKFPHILAPHSNFGTNVNQSTLIEDSMILSTPVYYRYDIYDGSFYTMTVGMPFLLGKL